MSKMTYSFGVDSSVNGQEEVTKESLTLLEFKTRIRDLLKPEYDDHYLSKWLKARNNDVAKAEQMFRASVAYKEKIDIEKLAKTYKPPEVLEKYLPGGFCGFDKEGRPVLIELYGYMDMKGILYSTKKSDIEKTKLLLGERAVKMLEVQSEKMGKHIDGLTVIIDLENVGTSLLWGPAPKIFPMLWKMIRPLVTEDMKKKVCILGADYTEELLQIIDADQLPAFLGGKMTDPDGNPRCINKICQGGTVPEKYFLKDLSESCSMVSAIVGRGEKLKLKYNVEKAGSILRYEFKTDGYDIGFGIFFENKMGQNEELVNVERVNSHMVPEDGTCICKKKGTYIVIFDNSYSWTKSKSIQYNIDVISGYDNTLKMELDTVTQGGSWERIAEETEVTRL